MPEAIIYRSPLEAWLWNTEAGLVVLGCLFLVWLVFAGLILRHILRINRNIHQMRRAQCRTGSHVDRRFRP